MCTNIEGFLEKSTKGTVPIEIISLQASEKQ
jgi:hypothetical protein